MAPNLGPPIGPERSRCRNVQLTSPPKSPRMQPLLHRSILVALLIINYLNYSNQFDLQLESQDLHQATTLQPDTIKPLPSKESTLPISTAVVPIKQSLQAHQQQPSQLFLPPVNAPIISLVSGFYAKKPEEEEEDGFIMKAASNSHQHQHAASTRQQQDSGIITTTKAPLAAITQPASEWPLAETISTRPQMDEQEQTTALEEQPAVQDDGNQRIAIDVNRPHYVTHDQLSLLNASTKDESINLASGSGDEATGDTAGEPTNTDQLAPQRAPQTASRAGMSKVSHVSSFLSDLFAYAIRPRQALEGTKGAYGGGEQNSPVGQRAASQNILSQHQPSATSTTSSPPAATTTTLSTIHSKQSQQQQQSPSTCPGVCRSILTASILCRNEIDAPCPSFLQRCCEKDDVSFNGTPVETSAPLSSDTLSPAQEQDSGNRQANLPHLEPPPQQAGAAPTANANAAPATPTPATAATTSTLDMLLLAGPNQSGSVYFLSSNNGSSESQAHSGDVAGAAHGDAGSVGGQRQPQASMERASQLGPAKQQRPTELAQSTNDESGPASSRYGRLPASAASQSFDPPLSEKSPPGEVASGSNLSGQAQRSRAQTQQAVLVQTANGTILHRPGERVRRPAYANWTDYHLSMMQARPGMTSNGQLAVNYHSNIDPVKRFSENSTTVASQSASEASTSTTTTTSTPQQPANNDLMGQYSSTNTSAFKSSARNREPTTQSSHCSGICLPQIHRRFCQAPSTHLRCEHEADFCCMQSNAELMNSIRRTLASVGPAATEKQASASQQGDERDTAEQVINDQHSGSVSPKLRASSPSSSASSNSVTTQAATPPPDQSTTPKSSAQAAAANGSSASSGAGQANSNDQQQPAQAAGDTMAGSDQSMVESQPIASVLVELLDSWIGGGGQRPTQPEATHVGLENQWDTNRAPGHQEQQNDRRLGLDLTFRQQSHQGDQGARNDSPTASRYHKHLDSAGSPSAGDQDQAAGLGLMTSDGGSEQSIASSGASGPLAISDSPADSQAANRCTGPQKYCTLPLFTSLCDSVYASPDCSPYSQCCARGSPGDESSSSANESPPTQAHSSLSATNSAGGSGQQQSGGQRQQQVVCRGSCLPVYHSSLCGKPNAIQFEPLGCPANHVCCLTPTALQDGTNHIDELEGLLSKGADQSGGQQPMIKDNSLFAALLPPSPPPPIAALASNSASEDQLMAASGRQRQSTALLSPQEASYQLYLQQRQQPAGRPSLKTNPASSSGAGGGIMSHLYQMFTSPKGRQRPAAAHQAQHPIAPQPMAAAGYLPQAFEAHQVHQFQQQQQPVFRAPNVAPGQQQVVFVQHGAKVNHPQFGPPASSGYQPLEGGAVMDMKQQQQPANRNRFMQQIDQQQFVGQQQPALVGGQTVQKSSPQHPQHQQPVNAFSHKQPVGMHAFNENNQLLINDKFAAGQFGEQSVPTFPSPASGVGAGRLEPQQPAVALGHAKQQQQPANGQLANQGKQLAPGVAQHQSSSPTVAAAASFGPPPSQRYHFNSADNAHQNNQQVPSAYAGVQQAQRSHQAASQQQQALSPMAPAKPSHFSYAGQQHPLGQQPAHQLYAGQKQSNAPPSAAGQQVTGATRPTANGGQQQQQRQVAAPQQDSTRFVSHEAPSVEQQRPIVRHHASASANSNNRQPTVSVAGGMDPSHRDNTEAAFAQAQPDNNNNAALSQPQAPMRAAAPAGARPTVEGSKQSNAKPPAELLPSPSRASGAPPKATNAGPSSTPADPMPAPPASPALMAPASSNLNVMISNGPYLDLQRVEQPLAATGNGGHPKRPSGAESAIRRQQAAVGIDDLSGSHISLGATSEQPETPAAYCPAQACVSAFNCVGQNQAVDENLACANPDAVCCIKLSAAAAAALPTEGAPVPSRQQQAGDESNGKKDLLQQTIVAGSRPTAPSSEVNSAVADHNIVDNNKLDASPISDQDEQLLPDEKQQSTAESQAVSKNESPDGSSSALGGATSDDRGSSASGGKNRFQATSCGIHGPRRRASSGQARARVMGGFDSRPGYWCWQAALMNNKNEYLCGGALIGTKWVLTAAHCVTQHLRNENQLYVRLGQHNLNSSQPDRHAKNIQVKTSYVHHNHNGVTLDNDIALLRLEEPVDLDDAPNICLVCLPERSSQVEPGKRCTVTGYGFETESGPAALRVRETELPVVSDQECQKRTSNVLGKPFALPASSFCAGGELGQDACHGDGGSPLSCLVDGYYELTGIVSWGYKCGSKDLPGLYSKVSTFVGWINQIVSVNN